MVTPRSLPRALAEPIGCCKQEVRAKPVDYGNVADQVHDGKDEDEDEEDYGNKDAFDLVP